MIIEPIHFDVGQNQIKSIKKKKQNKNNVNSYNILIYKLLINVYTSYRYIYQRRTG